MCSIMMFLAMTRFMLNSKTPLILTTRTPILKKEVCKIFPMITRFLGGRTTQHKMDILLHLVRSVILIARARIVLCLDRKCQQNLSVSLISCDCFCFLFAYLPTRCICKPLTFVDRFGTIRFTSKAAIIMS